MGRKKVCVIHVKLKLEGNNESDRNEEIIKNL